MMRPTSNPRCRGCRFSCATCRWLNRQNTLGRAPLDMADPRVVDALFTRPAGDLGDAMDAELDRGDERCDQMREDPDLYDNPRD